MEATWAEFVNGAMEWIRASGWVGVLAFIGLYTATCVVFLPGSVLTLGAGAVWGFWFSTALVAFSSTLGAVVNFLTSRYLLRSWMQKKIGHTAQFYALEKAVGVEGWRIVMISRISPVVPHSIVSYASGLTNLSFVRYTFATFVGFLPISAAYSYAGAILGKVARTSAGVSEHDPVQWMFYGIGVIATVVVTVWSTRAATRALREHERAAKAG